ncbi:unnamed protein product, partial [Closterium sp. NIES-54]
MNNETVGDVRQENTSAETWAFKPTAASSAPRTTFVPQSGAQMAQETGDGGTAEEQSCAEVIDDHVAECSEEEALDHDDDDDVSDSGDDAVLLGFVQKPSHDWSLARHRFPSKVGGAPVSEARRM